MVDWIEKAENFVGSTWAKVRSVTKGDEYNIAFDIMEKWNNLKNDMYEGRLIPEYGIHGSDNLCRIGAGIEIGQRAAKLRAEGKDKEADALIESCLELSSLREKADSVRKSVRGGSNKDADKDEENLRKGIELGLKNPNTDKWKILQELDLNTGTFKKGYNNGFADYIKKNYQFGKGCKSTFTKEEGAAISDLIKKGMCADLKEALDFMNKYKEKSIDIVKSAGYLAEESRGAVSFKEAIAMVAKEEERKKKLALRNTMRKDQQLASAQINSTTRQQATKTASSQSKEQKSQSAAKTIKARKGNTGRA